MPLQPLPWVLMDFETASGCDLKKSGAWRYSEDPTTEVLCLAYTIEGLDIAVWTPQFTDDDPTTSRLLNCVRDDRIMFIAHNVQFEKAIWRNIMVAIFGWPDIPDNRWHDSMATCAMKVLPLDLDRAATVLRLPYQKDRAGSALTKSLSKPNKKTGMLDRSAPTLEKVYDYCRQDIRAEVALHERVGWLSPGERKVWLLDQRINQRGVRLDLPFITAAQMVVDKASGPLEKEFGALTKGLKTTQVQKIGEWVKGQGVSIPNLSKETLAELLGETEDGEEVEGDLGGYDQELPSDVRRALRIRQLIGSASVKKLARMHQCVCADGRARGILQYHGAGPGRWAARLFQPHNFPRGSLTLDGGSVDPQMLVDAIMTGDPEYVEMMFGPAVEAVVSGLRHTIIAEPNRTLLSGDFSTIELRVNLALAGQMDKIELLAGGADPYIDMAQLIFKRPLTKKNMPERQTGKNSVLGLGFQMGAPKFRMKYAKTEPLEFCTNIVNIFRKEWAPLIPTNWRDLERAAIDVVHRRVVTAEAKGCTFQLEDGFLTIRLPSGRKLWYYNPQPCRKAMPWDDTDIRLAWTYQVMKMGQWKTVDAYGGLLTENVVQALARDLLVCAMFKCEANGLPVVLTVHDEVVTEPETVNADELAFKQIMCDSPPWARELKIPVATETWIGDRYKK